MTGKKRNERQVGVFLTTADLDAAGVDWPRHEYGLMEYSHITVGAVLLSFPALPVEVAAALRRLAERLEALDGAS